LSEGSSTDQLAAQANSNQGRKQHYANEFQHPAARNRRMAAGTTLSSVSIDGSYAMNASTARLCRCRATNKWLMAV
jgi:hypothetical protein